LLGFARTDKVEEYAAICGCHKWVNIQQSPIDIQTQQHALVDLNAAVFFREILCDGKLVFKNDRFQGKPEMFLDDVFQYNMVFCM